MSREHENVVFLLKLCLDQNEGLVSAVTLRWLEPTPSNPIHLAVKPHILNHPTLDYDYDEYSSGHTIVADQALRVSLVQPELLGQEGDYYIYMVAPLFLGSWQSMPVIIFSSNLALRCLYGVTRVSTAPVEYAPPAPDFDFHREIARLRALRSKLYDSKTLNDKVRVIDSDSRVKRFLRNGVSRLGFLNLDNYELFLLKCVIAAGQEQVIGSFSSVEGDFESTRGVLKGALYTLVEMIENWDVNGGERLGEKDKERLKGEEIGVLRTLLKTLKEMEKFYDCIGGIIGYQIAVLELLAQSTYEGQTISGSQSINESTQCQFLEIHPPNVLDLSQDTEYAAQAALWGIQGLPDLGEIYPLGGSADRLGLVDPDTGECLPAAMLPYCGRTLLEGLIRDLQQRTTMNTSRRFVKDLDGLEEVGHFSNFLNRRWAVAGQKTIHARLQAWWSWCVIWKLAYDKGIFQWFYGHGRKGATVRQVSNVVAATDLTLLALAGIGLHHGKDEFPANTNILYVDLPSAELIGSSNNQTSLPGLVLNTKKEITYVDQFGIQHRAFGGRLECTMQNIADNFFSTYSSQCNKGVEDVLDTFIVYNERRKVTSSAKKKRRHAHKSLHQTPDGSLLDIIRNAYDLLSQCDIKIPKIEGNDKYVDSGPPYLIFLHPALGPLWEVTRQKFCGGSISEGSELQIEVAEFLWRDVQLDGSLIVVAENILGSTRIDANSEQKLQYGHRCGRCKLQNVKVLNEGIDWASERNIYWKHAVHRFEALKVILNGNAEFEATDVVLQGNHVFEVPNGYKLKITSGNSGLAVQLDPIEEKLMETGSWFWNYKINGTHIELELVEL
ncbi:UDP-glucose pyrophosphorylase 3 [Actinidia rufa]|uniref:UDP-glucose pyrophosphorylase 3 n=1 Tax=Actinidia rufa TaxID=165716 RepID=A0A7J0EAJ5_9ERIC|nr:UDP-glucose pyrophosphorylase 3 [Actinidia rufa]